jgi:hypothetical protein
MKRVDVLVVSAHRFFTNPLGAEKSQFNIVMPFLSFLSHLGLPGTQFEFCLPVTLCFSNVYVKSPCEWLFAVWGLCR